MVPPFDERRVGVLLASDHDDICKAIKPFWPPKSIGLAGIPSFDANGWPGIFVTFLSLFRIPGFQDEVSCYVEKSSHIPVFKTSSSPC
jgi:hypothetical protein